MAEIMVIGGGIAGTAAALGLHKAGFDVTVHEAHPDSGADGGAFLSLASNGMRALAELDAAAAVAELGFPLATMRVLDEAGAQLADVPLGEHDQVLTSYRCLRRAELAECLRRLVRDRGIPIRHGARLVGLTEGPSGATATFADGSSATAELAVGADGLNSAVRGQLDPGAPRPEYAGQRVFYGYTAAAPTPSEECADRITMVRGSGAAFGYAYSPAGEAYWFARVPGPPASAAELAGTGPAQWREQLLPLLRPDRTPTADIVAATTDRLMVTNAQHLPAGGNWRGKRTVLVGDAAHAASPATGQGASMALEDAVVLAKALRDALPDADARPAALERYERLRRPRAEQNMETSAKLTASRTTTTAAPRDSAHPAPRVDDGLLRLLDWRTPLPEDGPEA
ncbi:2-polyprenyl-6-methoxyphenol hydroxylase-like FAD-dependent oxidoreductase [Kitasatospora sp. GAS204A]|uniref:FAD-dependent oxidoreductase n=1 Tax=unclassified Kitasatospora TaxID=2633591 RepID=UPI0024748DE1|nr:FAD-dependent monooxygenase [Kitasatospora sp. GAS204B]MDH6120484.1 2-polyprenyl-6-methoxyphenol hydroxylase-like FAD-dependent oxidoreductase [Kitasatospora sp. GAS204B]